MALPAKRGIATVMVDQTLLIVDQTLLWDFHVSYPSFQSAMPNPFDEQKKRTTLTDALREGVRGSFKRPCGR